MNIISKSIDILAVFGKYMVVGVVLATIFTYFFGFVVVDGESMLPNLKTGDHGFAQKELVEYNRNDIVYVDIYNEFTDERQYLIKRIIGLPGETVIIKNNVVYINGRKLDEDYLLEDMDTQDLTLFLGFNQYFVMGDNRNNSFDSRILGSVHKDNIKGKILFIF